MPIQSKLEAYFLNPEINPKDIQEFLNSCLFNTLDRESSLEKLDSLHKSYKQQVCTYQFSSGDPAYVCLDCQTDTTCLQCVPCYKNSNHIGHEVRMVCTGGGGCCDCGDIESWKKEGFCSNHVGLHSEESPRETVSPLTVEETQSSKEVIDWVINFFTDALTERQNVFMFMIDQKNLKGHCEGINMESETESDTEPSSQFHKRFFASERNAVTVKKKNDNYILYLHNTEACDWKNAVKIVMECMEWDSKTCYPVVNMVDYAEFCAVFVGDLQSCKSYEQKFTEKSFATSILKAPDKYFLVSIETVSQLLKWLLKLCTTKEIFRAFMIESLKKPLNITQNVALSPFTKIEREIFISSQFNPDPPIRIMKETKTQCELIENFVRGKSGEPEFLSQLDQYMIDDIKSIKTKSGVYMFGIENIGVKVENGRVLYINYTPVEYESLVYDEEENVVQDRHAEKNKLRGGATARMDNWIEYNFFVTVNKKLRHIYTDLILSMMIDLGFKEFWGYRFMYLYIKLLNKETDVHVTENPTISLAMSVQIFTIQKIVEKMIREKIVLETFLELFEQLSHKCSRNREIDYNIFAKKSSIAINDLLYIMNPNLMGYFLSKEGCDSLILFIRCIGVFDNMLEFSRTDKTDINTFLHTDNCWYYTFELEHKITNLVNTVIESMEDYLDSTLNADCFEIRKITDKLLDILMEKLGKLPKIRINDIYDTSYWPNKDTSTFHHPTLRLVVYFLSVMLKKRKISMDFLIECVHSKPGFDVRCLFEQSIRLISVVAEIETGKRENRPSFIGQTAYYLTHFQDQMLDKDILSMQIGICLCGGEKFFHIIFRRFPMFRPLDLNEKRKSDNKSIRRICFLIDFINKLYLHRYDVGCLNKQEIIKDILIHHLILSPLTFSEALGKVERFALPKKKDLMVEKTISKIATLKNINLNKPGKYFIKTDYTSHYNPYRFLSKRVRMKMEENIKTTTNANEILFKVPFKLDKNFEKLKSIFSCNIILLFISLMLNKNWNSKIPSELYQSCLNFVYIGILECKNKSFSESEKVAFLEKLNKNFDTTCMDLETFYTETELMEKMACYNKNGKYDSIIECICRINLIKSSKKAVFVLAEASKMDENTKKVVLKHYSSLEKLSNKIDVNERRKKLILIKNNAENYIKEKIDNFCKKNNVAFKNNIPDKETKKDLCIFCFNDTEKLVFLLCYTHPTNILLTTSVNAEDRKNFFKRLTLCDTISNQMKFKNISTCSHIMHDECFSSFYGRVASNYRYENLEEFMCPFCGTIGNTIIPVFSHKKKKTVDFDKSFTLDEWFEAIESKTFVEKTLSRHSHKEISTQFENYLNDIFTVSPFSNPDIALEELLMLKDNYYSILPRESAIKEAEVDKEFLRQVILSKIALFYTGSVLENKLSSFENSWGKLESLIKVESPVDYLKLFTDFVITSVDLLDFQKLEDNRQIQIADLIKRGIIDKKSDSLPFQIEHQSQVIDESDKKRPKFEAQDEIHDMTEPLRCALEVCWAHANLTFAMVLISTRISFSEELDLESNFFNSKRVLNILSGGNSLHSRYYPDLLKFCSSLTRDERCSSVSFLITAENTDKKAEIVKDEDSPCLCAKIDILSQKIKMLDLRDSSCFGEFKSELEKTGLHSNTANRGSSDFNKVIRMGSRFLNQACLLLFATGLIEKYEPIVSADDYNNALKKYKLLSFQQVLKKYVPTMHEFLAEFIKSGDKEISHSSDIDGALRKGFGNPSLISLPVFYDSLFQEVTSAKCSNCMKKPFSPAICLYCGDVLCVKSLCCTKNQKGELSSHSEGLCGLGSGAFLLPKKNILYFLSNGNAIEYISPYINNLGDNDKYLSVGKCLKLEESLWLNIQKIVFSGKIHNEVKRIRALFNGDKQIRRYEL